jgi:hypothetical protein
MKANGMTGEGQLTSCRVKLTKITVNTRQYSYRKLEKNTTQIICGVCWRGGAKNELRNG